MGKKFGNDSNAGANQFGGETVSIQIENVLHGIAQNVTSAYDEFIPEASIPRIDGSIHILPKPDLAWLDDGLRAWSVEAQY